MSTRHFLDGIRLTRGTGGSERCAYGFINGRHLNLQSDHNMIICTATFP